MKIRVITIIGAVLLLCCLFLNKSSYSECIRFTSMDMKQELDKAIVNVGVETAVPINVAVSGVLATPNYISIPANTSQAIRIDILGETLDGTITFSNPEQGVLTKLKLGRELLKDAVRVADFLSKFKSTIDDCSSLDESAMFTCGLCGATSSIMASLFTIDTACSVSTAGVCSSSYMDLVPFIPIEGYFCVLCIENRALALAKCMKSTFSLFSHMHCKGCYRGTVIIAPPSPPSNLRIIK